MGSTIEIRLRVPVQSRDGEGRSLEFRAWLPDVDQDALEAESDGISARLWFHESFVPDPGAGLSRELAYQFHLPVERVGLDLVISGVDDSLVKFIRARGEQLSGRGDAPNWDTDGSLAKAYQDLGQRAYSAAVDVTGRLLAYVRASKGQYWLSPIRLEPKDMLGFYGDSKARVRSESFGWLPWWPPMGTQVTVGSPRQSPRWIDKTDWAKIAEHVKRGRSSDLVGELLANAEELLWARHSRAALVEAVAALEVAVGRFASRYGQLPLDAQGLDPSSASRMLENLGLRGFLSFVLPLLVGAQTHDLLRACRVAVDLRGTVVHHGQRAVQHADVVTHVGAIRELCNLLGERAS